MIYNVDKCDATLWFLDKTTGAPVGIGKNIYSDIRLTFYSAGPEEDVLQIVFTLENGSIVTTLDSFEDLLITVLIARKSAPLKYLIFNWCTIDKFSDKLQVLAHTTYEGLLKIRELNEDVL